jgi:hypothetical protein
MWLSFLAVQIKLEDCNSLWWWQVMGKQLVFDLELWKPGEGENPGKKGMVGNYATGMLRIWGKTHHMHQLSVTNIHCRRGSDRKCLSVLYQHTYWPQKLQGK